MAEEQGKFEGWAVVELFGHSREIGYVTTQYFGDKAMFQIDAPAREEREYALTSPKWIDGVLAHAGSVIRLGAATGKTRIIGPGAVYALNPCDKEAALQALDNHAPREIKLVTLAKSSSLGSGDADEGEVVDAEWDENEQSASF